VTNARDDLVFLVLHDPPGGGSFAEVQEHLSYEVNVAASSAQTADHSDWHWMKTIKTPKKTDMEAAVDPAVRSLIPLVPLVLLV
jgi:hypothetical protein